MPSSAHQTGEGKSRAGLLIVNTGDGKGKTTAAFGAAMRAAGHEQKVLVVQFIKGPWVSGEVKAAGKLRPFLQVRCRGRGFVDPARGPTEEDRKAAGEELAQTAADMASGEYDLVVLDEIFAALEYGLVPLDGLVKALDSRRPGVNVILTGRNAPGRLLRMADTVTEFVETRHPFKKGIAARKGIEF